MKKLLIQRWSSWMLQPYDFDIHKGYGQSTSNKKSIRSAQAHTDDQQSIRSAQAHNDDQLKQKK
jgi:hypothetical protein